MRLGEREHADRGSLPDGCWFQRFKSRASTVFCTGTLREGSHPQRVEAN